MWNGYKRRCPSPVWFASFQLTNRLSHTSESTPRWPFLLNRGENKSPHTSQRDFSDFFYQNRLMLIDFINIDIANTQDGHILPSIDTAPTNTTIGCLEHWWQHTININRPQPMDSQRQTHHGCSTSHLPVSESLQNQHKLAPAHPWTLGVKRLEAKVPVAGLVCQFSTHKFQLTNQLSRTSGSAPRWPFLHNRGENKSPHTSQRGLSDFFPTEIC